MVTKNYDRIAKEKIRRPSQMEGRLPRLLVYGRNKKGKTRFCVSAGQGKVLILDPEHGTDQMRQLDPHVWPIEKWEDIDEAYRFLKLGNHSYEWCAVDGLTRMHNMGLRWVMKLEEERSLDRQPGLVQMRDHGKAGEMTKGLIQNFHTLPMGIIFTAQERQEAPFEEEDEDAEASSSAFVPDLPKGARSSVNGIVDAIGRIYTVQITKKFRNRKTEEIDERKVLERRLWLAPHTAYDTGYRSDYTLPAYLPNPTVPKLVGLLNNGE